MLKRRDLHKQGFAKCYITRAAYYETHHHPVSAFQGERALRPRHSAPQILNIPKSWDKKARKVKKGRRDGLPYQNKG